MAKKVRRLVDQFRPENYNLQLKPDREKLTFTGTVIVKGQKAGRPSRRITLHQKDLKIRSAKVIRHGKKGDQAFDIDRINLHKSLDEVRLHAKDMLFPGNYTMQLEFSGKITRAMNGMYPCFYKHDGKDKRLIMSQFESHHAREAFPCIDEPEAKATFDLTLTTPKDETVLANTEIKQQKTVGASFVTTFETTPVMSTYLLAFIYGELHGITAKSKSGVKVSTWATIAQPKEHLEYSNQEAIGYLDFFEDYFKTPFPLKKLDQVAVPDFEVLGMENWGLITGREVGFLNDPANPSISSQRLSAMLISHEVSHMWFGDLVTMKWWDDLWLNESFASIMESLGPDRRHPDWQEWEDFAAGRLLGAANRDVYKDIQSVGVEVNHPDEIHTIFDPSIVYGKGARVLKMLYDYIGDEAFRKGLQSYFKKYAYKNTTRDDLWAELSASSGQDIGKLMTPWIEQSGTPELIVKQQADKINLSQKRFLLDSEDSRSVWPIPLLNDSGKNLGVLAKKSKNYALSEVPFFNPDGFGHFIVRYEDEASKQKLRDGIVSRQLNSSGRIVALNDMLLQAQKGELKLTEILDLVKACKNEDRDAVWTVFLRAIGNTQILTDGDKAVDEKLKKFKRELAAGWFKKLGWDDQPGDDPNTKQLRVTAISMSVAGENPGAIKAALDKFTKVKTVEALPAEQRAIIAGAAVRFGKPGYVNQLMKEYESTQNRAVQDAIAAALCSTRDAKVAKAIEKWGMHDVDIIKPQDIDHFFAFLMRNPYTREVAWHWLTASWPKLAQIIGEKKMEYFIWYASRPLSTSDWQKRYKQFFEPKINNLTLKRNILVSFSEIEERVKWRQREEPLLKKYFLG